MMPENRNIPENEIQNILFLNWLNELQKIQKRKEYKIPAKITELPCGCKRERTNESDPNNTWKLKYQKKKYIHKECGTELK